MIVAHLNHLAFAHLHGMPSLYVLLLVVLLAAIGVVAYLINRKG